MPGSLAFETTSLDLSFSSLFPFLFLFFFHALSNSPSNSFCPFSQRSSFRFSRSGNFEEIFFFSAVSSIFSVPLLFYFVSSPRSIPFYSFDCFIRSFAALFIRSKSSRRPPLRIPLRILWRKPAIFSLLAETILENFPREFHKHRSCEIFTLSDNSIESFRRRLELWILLLRQRGANVERSLLSTTVHLTPTNENSAQSV